MDFIVMAYDYYYGLMVLLNVIYSDNLLLRDYITYRLHNNARECFAHIRFLSILRDVRRQRYRVVDLKLI